MWQVTRDTWHITGGEHCVKCLVLGSYGLIFMVFLRFGVEWSVTQSVNDGSVCRTALATPGLLIIILQIVILNYYSYFHCSGVVLCNDTVDWVSTPLATVHHLSPKAQYLPCNLKWSNLQMLMSDQSCVRFTVASDGPVYFALSAVPSNPETWYYTRISEVGRASLSYPNYLIYWFRWM